MFQDSRRFITGVVVLSAITFGATNLISSGEVSACAFLLGQQKSADKPRRPLPKPSNGARGFEQFNGRDASNQLIATGATRSVSSALKPVAPNEGLAYDALPFFRWMPAYDAKSYRFVLRDAVDPKAPIIYQAEVATPQLLYPKNAPALEPGKLYSWRVTISTAREKKAGPSVNFFILAGDDAAEVRRALEKAKLTKPQSVEEKLQQARIFEQYGVWYDALRNASEATANSVDTAAKDYYDALMNRLKEAQESASQESDQ